jgi:dTDP-4-dehydrorhamnose 3,5-epimerase
MIFTETAVTGAFVIDLERIEDDRGFFARAWCRREFEAHGLNAALAQCSVSRSHAKGTLRGLHYQARPHEESKIVRCTRGAIYDVVVDLRETSNTFLRHAAVVLTSENHQALYVPEGCAHGFLTLEADSEVFYQISVVYNASAARGVRWNDPRFGIEWPAPVVVMSERDRTCPDFEPGRAGEPVR